MIVFFHCSILNKLTPDNFEKLSLGVTHHAGIGNKDTLKGIILLVSSEGGGGEERGGRREGKGRKERVRE